MSDWISKINEIKLERTPGGITTVIIIAVVGLILSILLFIGLRKCIAYGESIDYSVLSVNIVLFAAPGIFILIYAMIGKYSELPWIPFIIGWVILWLIAIIRNIINCKSAFYTIVYIFYQLLIAALLIVGIISIIGIAIFAFAMLTVKMVGGGRSGLIYLAPYDGILSYDSSKMIAARKSDDKGEYLSGVSGEMFHHAYEDKYYLISAPDSSLENQLYIVVR